MAAPAKISTCGTTPTAAFPILAEDHLRVTQIVYAPTQRITEYDTAGGYDGVKVDLRKMTVSFTADMTGTGVDIHSAAVKTSGTTVTSHFNNFAAGTSINGHDANDGCVLFMNPNRTLTTDNTTMTFELEHYPHAA